MSAIDLFSGAGGASLGLTGSGYDLRLAVEIHPEYGMTHAANLPGQFLAADLRAVDADKVTCAADVGPGELDVMFAGPPCQGFSMIGSRVVWDERNNLFLEVLRLARDLRPRVVVIENVPGLLTLADGAYLRAILGGLQDSGYRAACAELLAAQYGAPQMRWRLVIIAWRDDLGIPPGYGFPAPSHGPAEIGDLLPNCTIRTEETRGFVTTREAIGDLPTVQAGGQIDRYVGPPSSAYQKTMRAGLAHELHNHYAANLSAANLERLRLLEPGQDWRDLPHEMLPPGMQRALRKDHTRRYRRIAGVPRPVRLPRHQVEPVRAGRQRRSGATGGGSRPGGGPVPGRQTRTTPGPPVPPPPRTHDRRPRGACRPGGPVLTTVVGGKCRSRRVL